jgi:uncharacterized protein
MNFKSILHSTVITLLMGMVIVFFGYAIVTYFTGLLLHFIPIDDAIRELIASIAGASGAWISYSLFSKIFEQRETPELSGHHFAGHASGGLATGFGIIALTILVLYFLGYYKIMSVNPVASLIPALAIGISSAVFEELLFRGILFRITEQRMGSSWALAFSSALFGFAHLFNSGGTVLSSIAIAIEAGLLLGGAYLLTRSLWFPIFIHFAWNFTEGGISGANVSGAIMNQSLFNPKIAGPEWLTGGDFGPENSLITVIIGLAVSIIFILIAKKRGYVIPMITKPVNVTEQT